jgi:hypothetical protein
MAWTTPRTWSTSELVTAAIMNVHVRDQMNEIYSSGRIFTSASTLSFGAAANAAQKFTVAGTLTTAIDSGSMLAIGGTLTVGANLSGYGLNVSPTIVEAASGTHNHLAGVIVAPTFTNGAGVSSSVSGLVASAFTAPTGAVAAATFRVSGAPTGGTTNYALLVDAGLVNLGPGLTCINDTSNANMTTGLTVNQGAADDEALALKSSDVAHGVTTYAETDTYGSFRKRSALAGGLEIRAIADTDDNPAFVVHAIGNMTNTTAATTASGGITLDVSDISGTGITTATANTFLFAVRNAGSAKFLIDADGDMYLDATSNPSAYDDEDDVPLLESFRELTARGPINFKHRFVKDLDEHRRILIQGGILTEGGFYRRRKESDELREALATMAGELSAVRATMARLEGRVN